MQVGLRHLCTSVWQLFEPATAAAAAAACPEMATESVFLPCDSTGVDAHTTLVIYMGLSTLPEVSRRLVAGGLPAGTPAVAIERGTLPSQRAVFAPLADLHQTVQAHELESPTLIVIGDVVSLAPGWQAQLEGGSSNVVPSSGQYMHLQTPGQLAVHERLGDAAFSQML